MHRRQIKNLIKQVLAEPDRYPGGYVIRARTLQEWYDKIEEKVRFMLKNRAAWLAYVRNRINQIPRRNHRERVLSMKQHVHPLLDGSTNDFHEALNYLFKNWHTILYLEDSFRSLTRILVGTQDDIVQVRDFIDAALLGNTERLSELEHNHGWLNNLPVKETQSVIVFRLVQEMTNRSDRSS